MKVQTIKKVLAASAALLATVMVAPCDARSGGGERTAGLAASLSPAQEAAVRSVIAAFEAAAPAPHDTRETADAKLVVALESITRDVQAAPDQDVLGVLVAASSPILAAEITGRAVDGGIDEGSVLGAALDRFRTELAARASWVAHAGADGPSNPCFTNLAACFEYCAYRGGPIMRAACGLDCSLDFASCMGEALHPVLNLVSSLETVSSIPVIRK